MDRKERMRQRQRQGMGERSPLMIYARVMDLGRLGEMVTQWFKPAAYTKARRTNLIDILPFEISTNWYNRLRQQNGNPVGLQPGDWDYKLEIPIHYNVGPSGVAVLCLREAFGEACAVCDEMFSAYAEKTEAGKERGKALQARWRNFYNLYDYDNPDEGFHAWDVSFHLFEKFLAELIQVDSAGQDFWFPGDGGLSIEFKGREKTLGKNEFIECYDFNFKPREPYGEDVVRQVVQWDQLLIIPTAAEVERLHLGIDDNGGGGEGESQRESTSSPTRDRSRPRPADLATRERAGEDRVPEGRAEPAPVRSSRTTRDRSTGGAPVATGGGSRCPAGHSFGAAINTTPDCKTCPDETFELCAAEGDKQSGATATPPPAPPARRRRG